MNTSYLNAFVAGEKAGVSYLIDVEVSGGRRYKLLTPEELVAFLENPCAYKAGVLGLTVEEYGRYIEYVTSDSPMVQCCAQTANKRRCRAVVPGTSQLSPEDWLRFDRAGGYCAIHDPR